MKRVGNSDHGWCQIPMGDCIYGFTIDLSQSGKSTESCEYILNDKGEMTDENFPLDWSAPENAYRSTVHNLEVEDDHIYFVGTHGVWVHNCLTYNIAGVGQNPSICVNRKFSA